MAYLFPCSASLSLTPSSSIVHHTELLSVAYQYYDLFLHRCFLCLWHFSSTLPLPNSCSCFRSCLKHHFLQEILQYFQICITWLSYKLNTTLVFISICPTNLRISPWGSRSGVSCSLLNPHIIKCSTIFNKWVSVFLSAISFSVY